MKLETRELPRFTPGVVRSIQIRRFGDAGARPKAYLQAALHADEIPPLLVAHALTDRLCAAEAAGELIGEVVLVPMANPIGTDQWVQGDLLGRTDLVTGGNFNRLYPDLAPLVAETIGPQLRPDANRNIEIVRVALRAALGEVPAHDEAAALRLTLMGLAIDADIALDLHCDSEALLHIYLGTPLWPAAQDLATALESPVTLLAEVSGGNPFDEAVAGPWWALAKQFPSFPIPPACIASTIEFRGEHDVSHELADRDADGLMRYLCAAGVLGEGRYQAPRGTSPNPMPLEGVSMERAPASGVLVQHAQLGELVKSGQLLAEVVVPQEHGPGSVLPVLATGSGILFARAGRPFVRRGQVVAKLAGSEPIPDRMGRHLLTD